MCLEKGWSPATVSYRNTLHELGFKGLRATRLRRKHVVALVREWKRQGRSIGTMKNRTAHIRWWAKRIGRPGVVPANGDLGIANREYVTNEDRSTVLDPEKLARVGRWVCVTPVGDGNTAPPPPWAEAAATISVAAGHVDGPDEGGGQHPGSFDGLFAIHDGLHYSFGCLASSRWSVPR